MCLPYFRSKKNASGKNQNLEGKDGAYLTVDVPQRTNVPKGCRTILLFVCNRGDTIQYHGGLRSRELGQAPILLVFLTPRLALSSHPRQQMVGLYWLEDRDSMPNWYTINHPTTLHTHNEIQ